MWMWFFLSPVEYWLASTQDNNLCAKAVMCLKNRTAGAPGVSPQARECTSNKDHIPSYKFIKTLIRNRG